MPKQIPWKRNLLIVFFLAVAWELFIFIRLPKQAFMQGLLESWMISKGLIFYRDFFGGYLPFLRLLMIPLHQIFGYEQYVTIALAPINSISILIVLYFAGRRWLRGVYSLIPITFFSVWQTFLSNNHFEATSFLGLVVLLSTVVWILWMEKPTAKRSLLIGFLSAAGIYTLQIVAPFYIFLNLSLFIKLGGNLKTFLFYLKYLLLGFIVPTLAIIGWFFAKGALFDLYAGTIGYFFTSYPYASLGKETENIIIFLAIHLPILLFLFTGYKKIKGVYFLLIFLMLPLTFWFAIFHPLRFEISLPSYALLAGLGVQEVLRARQVKFQRFAAGLIILILCINAFTIFKYKLGSLWENLFEKKYSHAIITELYSDDPMYDAVVWMKQNSRPEDRIFVLADSLFYLKSGRLPANRRAMASEAFVYYPFNKFEDEIRASWPSFWVIDERQWARMDDYGYIDVRENFQKLVETDPVVAKFDYLTIRKHIPQKQEE